MAIKTYDPSQVSIVLGGVPGFAAHIVEGWMSCTVSYEDDAWEHSVGADGEEMRSKKNDLRATMTITLTQSSASNDAFSLLAAIDRTSNAGTPNLMIRDRSGASFVESESAWVKKSADLSRERGPSDIEWTFSLSNAIIYHGGH